MDLTTLLPIALLDAGPFSTLAAAAWISGALTVLFLICSVILILTILIQRPQGGGLSGAFGGGGGGSGETAFGARTGDALTIATISIFVIWLLIAVGLVLDMRPSTAPNPNAAAVSTDTPTNDSATPADQSSTGTDSAGQDQSGAADQPATADDGASESAPESDTAPATDAPANDAPDTTGETPDTSTDTDTKTDTPDGTGGG